MATAQGPCRFGQYVTLHRQILDREGFPDVPILAPSSYMGYAGLDEPIRRQIFKAMLVGDILMKAGCKVRPYERETGETNYRLEQEMARLASVFESGGDVTKAVGESVRRIASVPDDGRPAEAPGGHRRRGLRPQQRVRERARRALDREAGRGGVDGAADRVGALHLVDVEPAPEPGPEVLEAAGPGLDEVAVAAPLGAEALRRGRPAARRPARAGRSTTCWPRR